MIFDDQTSSFQELQEKNNSFTVHHFNIQSFATEIFQNSNNIAPTIIDDLFTISNHSYRHFSNLTQQKK